MKDLKDTRNSLDLFVALFENLGKIPEILHVQKKILDILERGGSAEFVSKLQKIAEQLEVLGETKTEEGG
jgi:hypothetical protein